MDIENLSFEENLLIRRAKHLFVQWLISGNRRTAPEEAQFFVRFRPDEARLLFDYYRKRSRRRPKGKKYLFVN